MSISHVFSGLFNQVDIEQVRFSYTCTKSIDENTKHATHNTEYVTQFINIIILNNRLKCVPPLRYLSAGQVITPAQR